MNGSYTEPPDEYIASEAREAGCEAIYIPDEEEADAGRWHFTQKYDEGKNFVIHVADPKGIIWKRLRWPWIALRTAAVRSDVTKKNLSRNVRSAESYLKDLHPEALIPQSLLHDSLRESHIDTSDDFNPTQGELLGLGTMRYARVGGTGRQVSGQWKRFCLTFPSGELRNHISNSSQKKQVNYLGVALVRWCTMPTDPESQLRVPFLTEKCAVDIKFNRQIQQIVFPPAAVLEDLEGIIIR